ncbi:MAG: hypothetical protein B6D58_09030 [candidate division Zixibacteria bacterium 4484_95]|nr:MAG: hypothetical protein B6D58_09030 [candidate division Zixibacteria bacterium 4484_95]
MSYRYYKGYLLICCISIFHCYSCTKSAITDGSGDGIPSGLIAFTAYEDSLLSDLDVYIVDAFEPNPVPFNVSNIPSNDYYASWLYDESAVVFISSTYGGASLSMVAPFGLDLIHLYSTGGQIEKISCSPTERKVAFIEADYSQAKYKINIIDTDNLDTLYLVSIHLAGEPLIAWSVDGRKLAIGAGIIHVYDALSGGLLYSISTSADYIAWNEDGNGLYVINSGDLSYADSINNYDILTGKNLSFGTISPDRKYLAAISLSEDNSLIVINLPYGDYTLIKTIHIPVVVYRDYRVISWSADGQELSYIDLDDGQWNIFTISRDGFLDDQVTDDYTLKKSICRSPVFIQ